MVEDAPETVVVEDRLRPLLSHIPLWLHRHVCRRMKAARALPTRGGGGSVNSPGEARVKWWPNSLQLYRIYVHVRRIRNLGRATLNRCPRNPVRLCQ